MELLALAPGWPDLDSDGVVEPRVALQKARGLRELGIKLQQVLATTNQSSEPEEAAE
jgi:hypothetical protein